MFFFPHASRCYSLVVQGSRSPSRERVRGDLRQAEEFIPLNCSRVVLRRGLLAQVAGDVLETPSTLSNFMNRFRRRSTSSLSTVARVSSNVFWLLFLSFVGPQTVGSLDNVVQDGAGSVAHGEESGATGSRGRCVRVVGESRGLDDSMIQVSMAGSLRFRLSRV